MSALTAATSGQVLKLPELREKELRNGLPVAVLERPGLPLVSLGFLVRAGSAHDPKGQFGVANFVGEMLRRGTSKRSASELEEAFEILGAELKVHVFEDGALVLATAPSENWPPVLALLSEVLSAPAFDAQEVAKTRRRLLADLEVQLDDPSAVADRAVLGALYGAHPYGHDELGLTRDVAKLGRAEIRRFYEANYGPRTVTLYAVGDLKAEELFEAAAKGVSDWVSKAEPPAQIPPPSFPQKSKVLVVDKQDATQTQVRIAAPAFARNGPDYFPATVACTAFGGGFTSRLVNEVRVNRGLSYGVSCRLGLLKDGGSVLIHTFTKTETTRELIDVVMAEAKKAREQSFTAEELGRSKNYLVGRFPTRVDTGEELLQELAIDRLQGLGIDFIEHYPERIQAIPPAEAARAAALYLYGGPVVFTLVGKASAFAEKLRDLGEIQVVPLSKMR